MQTQSLTETQNPPVALERAEAPRVRPLVNVTETAEAYGLELLVPGVAKEAVELQVEQGVLQVRAESALVTPEGLKARIHEFGGVVYERRFTLPEDVDASGIEASLRDGLLHVRLPKRDEVKPRSISIA